MHSSSYLQPDLLLRPPALLLAALLILAGSAFATKETVILPFDVTDGMTPLSGFVADKAGNLYGVTSIGGSGDCSDFGGGGGCGTVYELSPPAKNAGAWSETVLYNFQGGADGDEVVGSLIFDKKGNLYGTTALGGGGSCTYGCGTVFELSPPAKKGGAWTKSIIYLFQGASADGSYPEAAMVFDRDGNLYGTTSQGGGPNCGGYGCGTVFELKPPHQQGETWTETVLHTFVGPSSTDGYGPSCNLVFDATGNLYGTTGFGGTYNNGAVFEMNPPAAKGDPWAESVIYSFIGQPDGASPSAGLVAGQNGSFYGSATGWGPKDYGTIFQLTPPAQAGDPWTETVLHAFTLQADGGNPGGGVILDTEGNLYGTTAVGGNYSCNAGFNDGCGVVFKLAPPAKQGGAWKQTVLHSFTGGEDGIQPESGLLIGRFGLLYGTTEMGGASGAGTVFIVGE
jgi:uncharacterized repeat protein (TIGR03803 family)